VDQCFIKIQNECLKALVSFWRQVDLLVKNVLYLWDLKAVDVLNTLDIVQVVAEVDVLIVIVL
jgi:hypothetical protein